MRSRTPARSRARRVAGRAATGLAALVVVVVLLAPHDPKALTAPWFARLPVEVLVLAAALLAARGRARRPVVLGAGVLLGLLAVLAVLDVGFTLALNRSFDLVLDWSLLGNAADYLDATGGTVAVVLGWAGAAGLALAVVALAVWAVRRVAGTLDHHRDLAVRLVAALSVVWVTAAVLGPQVAPGTPFASRSAGTLVVDRVQRVDRTLHDLDDYAVELASDGYRDAPADRLLTGLRGKDVLVVFVESYGRVALEDPAIAPGVTAVLDDGTSRLTAAGFGARTGWLESSTFGGASWLAHSTLLSGTEVDNPQRYRRLLASDRFTLTTAFERAGWRTVAAMPSLDGAWPEEDLYGYDRVLQKPDFGYRGPSFGWSPMPDQFVLETLQREELEGSATPVMAEVALTSSHAPWAPLPRTVDWTALGDGSVFAPFPAQGNTQREVWRDPSRVRTEFGHSIEYCLTTLVEYVERYGDDDTVLLVLGDHQPLPLVSGVGATRDVPVSIVAKDPAVLAAVDGWGWDSGLEPSADTPVTPMRDLRDRFLGAFSDTP